MAPRPPHARGLQHRPPGGRSLEGLLEGLYLDGLRVPSDLRGLLRTIFFDPSRPDTERFYDQIAWFGGGTWRLLSMEYVEGGNFDFLPHAYTDADLSRSSISYGASDHYPFYELVGLEKQVPLE